jgi:hypothetical protein
MYFTFVKLIFWFSLANIMDMKCKKTTLVAEFGALFF